MSKIFAPIITPNPTTGMTIINSKIIEIIKNKETFTLYNFNKPSYIKNHKVWVIYKNIKLILLALTIPMQRLRGYSTIYNVPASDKALFVSFFIFLMANIFMKRIIHHHHVFSYINKKNKWISLMEKIGKNKIENIFLCNTMKDKYNSLYKNTNDYFILDNSYLLLNNLYKKDFNKSLNIGYLSNITIDKGFEIFCDACKLLLKKDSTITIHIAGPIIGGEEKKLLDDLKTNFHKNIKYYGSVYGEDKNTFLNTINVFLFPTIYKNEAQPLVIYEALAHNNLVISMNRGCIQDQISISKEINDPVKFIEKTLKILSDEKSLEIIREEQFEKFKTKFNKKEEVLKELNEFLFKNKE